MHGRSGIERRSAFDDSLAAMVRDLLPSRGGVRGDAATLAVP